MFIGDVILLSGVSLYIIKLLAVDQPPLLRHHRALPPLLRIFDPLRVDKQRTVGPLADAVLKQGGQTVTIELYSPWFL